MIMPVRSKRVTRLASSSFQLASLYAFCVCLTLLGLYFYSSSVVEEINQLAGDTTLLEESYIFSKLAPLIMLVMIGIAGLSFFISEFVVRRINSIQQAADDIIRTNDLSRRIPIENEWDDLSKLAITLNDMLQRIESLLQDIRTVSDNIAHDMRTPLSRLHQHIEMLEHQLERQQPQDLRITISTLKEEADRLLNTFNALLRISNIEKGRRKAEIVPVILSDLIQDVLDLYEPLAADKGIMLEVVPADEALELQADKHLLFQALANLLDNAIKYTREGGSVRLTLYREEQTARIELADEGPGIAPDDYTKVFQRFYRGESCRASEGSGLGLSLVKAIIELHHGTIALADNQPGLRVILCFPLRRSA